VRLRPLLCLALTVSVGCIVACGAGDDEPGIADSDGGDPSTLGAEAGTGSGSGSSGEGGTPGKDASSPGDAEGGALDAGPQGCIGSAEDPAAATTVSGFIDKLTGTKPTGTLRTQVIDAIIKSCHVFGPRSATGWKPEYCWAHLVSAISKESSYNATVAVVDAYAKRPIGAQTANDPVVGLLQVRFSSTVNGYVNLGNIAALSCVGCTFPASVTAHKGEAGSSPYWAVTGPTQNLALMQSAQCNVGLGAWYYYLHASGNGNPAKATYVEPYCKGQGTAGNLITGLRSHLEGSETGRGVIADQAALNALQGTNANAYSYVNAIKTSFDKMIPAPSGKHPFFITLAPNPSQYCE
jgi:hypothetical protein